MQEGKFPAQLKTYGFVTGQTDPQTQQQKPPQFYATFEFADENNVPQSLSWFGGFMALQPGKKNSQRSITIDTIKLMGYQGAAEQLGQLASGVESNLLDTNKEYSIDVQYAKNAMQEVQVDNSGNPKFKIQWVNDPSQGGFKNTLNVQDATVILGGLNLGSEFLTNGQNNSGGNGFNLNQNNNNGQNMGNQNNGQNNNGGGGNNTFNQNGSLNQNNNNGQQNFTTNNGANGANDAPPF